MSSIPGTQASPAISGNYLLAGSLPTSPLFLSNAPFSLGATFDTIGSQVAAVYSVSVPCTTSTYGFTGGGDLTGTLASDGSFTLQSPLPVTVTTAVALTIKGVAPATKGSPWSGTYTLTTTNTFCPGTLMGAITATPIADVSGTYTGAANLATTGSLTGSLVSVSAALQQATPVTTSFGSTVETHISLSGTLSIKASHASLQALQSAVRVCRARWRGARLLPVSR